MLFLPVRKSLFYLFWQQVIKKLIGVQQSDGLSISCLLWKTYVIIYTLTKVLDSVPSLLIMWREALCCFFLETVTACTFVDENAEHGFCIWNKDCLAEFIW